jgi:hypothetical protein
MTKNAVPAAFLFLALAGSPSTASAQLIPSADGRTVYDAHLKVRWLADANLAHSPDGKVIATNASLMTITADGSISPGGPISPGGSMDFTTAMEWLTAVNAANGDGYLHHSTWTLPTSPIDPSIVFPPFPPTVRDPSCTSTGPGGGGFGYGCTIADMAGLYNLTQSLGLQWPDTASPLPDVRVGPFHNFQPYLYWTSDAGQPFSFDTGAQTFSFNTGWTGSNTLHHYMYVLPMIQTKVDKIFGTTPVTYVSSGVGSLQVSVDGLLVYDPVMDITWLADADLAKSQTFGAQCASYVSTTKATTFPLGIPCIAPDGSMAGDTANKVGNPGNGGVAWIDGMNAYNGVGWLGRHDWKLPASGNCGGHFGCLDSALGELFHQLGLDKGAGVFVNQNVSVGPFYDVQPYLYWSCGGPVTIDPPCHTPTPLESNQEWSFSFGNGFQGTDLQGNDLYVMLYFQQTPAAALTEAIVNDLGSSPELNSFLAQANDIIIAPNGHAKTGRLIAFVNHVNAQTGNALNIAQAGELIALAQVN